MVGQHVDQVRYSLVLTVHAGRSFLIMPSGTIDAEEDYEHGYGGEKLVKLLQDEGIAALFPGVIPTKI